MTHPQQHVIDKAHADKNASGEKGFLSNWLKTLVPADLQSAAAANGFDWSQLVQFFIQYGLPALLALLQQFIPKPPTPPTPAKQ